MVTADGADGETGFDLIVEPSDVPVKLDGEGIGLAPLKVRNLSPGSHKIEIEAPPGFFNKTKQIDVERGQAPLVEIELPAMEITGRFVSVPEGAAVTLISDDGEEKLGSAPAESDLDPSKTYEVKFEKDGFQAATRPVKIASRPVIEVEVELEPEPEQVASSDDRTRESTRRPPRRERRQASRDRRSGGRDSAQRDEPAGKGELLISSKPPCKIYIDGRDTGLMTPQRGIELAAGTRRITLVNDTFGIRESFSVRITAGEPSRVVKDMSDRLE